MNTKLFFDMEFTGLHQKTTPISIGIVAETGETFYAEFTDYDKSQVDDWIQSNIIDKLSLTNYITKAVSGHEIYPLDKNTYSNALEMALAKKEMGVFECIGKTEMVKDRLEKWLFQFESITIWGDCLAYDWVLFCQIFGGAFSIPKNIYYIPFDLCTLFTENCVDPDIEREVFAYGVKNDTSKHNSLFDAIVIRDCYNKLKSSPFYDLLIQRRANKNSKKNTHE